MIKCFNINTASVFTTITIWVPGPGQGDNYWYSLEFPNFDIDTGRRPLIQPSCCRNLQLWLSLNSESLQPFLKDVGSGHRVADSSEYCTLKEYLVSSIAPCTMHEAAAREADTRSLLPRATLRTVGLISRCSHPALMRTLHLCPGLSRITQLSGHLRTLSRANIQIPTPWLQAS